MTAIGEKQKPALVTKVLVRADVPDTMNKGIRSSGRMEKVDLELASREHAAYKQAIRDAGGHVMEIPKSKHPDSVYVQDTAYIMAGSGSDWKPIAIIANPGNPDRRKEVGEIKEFVGSLGIETIKIKGKGTFIEFGDVERVGNTMIIGLSERTNFEGAMSFMREARRIDPSITSFQLQNIEGVLHLTTGMTPLTKEVFLKSPHLTADIVEYIAGKKVIELDPKDAYAANVLQVNGGVVVPKEFQTVYNLALQYYDESKVQQAPTSQTQILNGSLTCASIVWQELARK
ncbi:MAG: hypothetical protein KGH69_03870 [Candidatus Micrarchaeota archaeon]|nr:hypothetical protein [Candidatus Micrarchaeota archaeon]